MVMSSELEITTDRTPDVYSRVFRSVDVDEKKSPEECPALTHSLSHSAECLLAVEGWVDDPRCGAGGSRNCGVGFWLSLSSAIRKRSPKGTSIR